MLVIRYFTLILRKKFEKVRDNQMKVRETMFIILINKYTLIGLGTGFMKYFDVFKPFLLQGLQNRAEYQVSWRFIKVL